jgi:dihydrofolate reductase
MRKVKLFIASSLDGYIAREDGGIDWLFSDADYGYRQFYDSVDTVIMGRKTHELEQKLGVRHEGKKSYVFSRRKSGGEFVHDAAEFTRQLVQENGKDIWLEGGGEVVSALMDEGLVDEIILSIHPIILGTGIPLFKSKMKEAKLELINSTAYESGLVQLHYQTVSKRGRR